MTFKLKRIFNLGETSSYKPDFPSKPRNRLSFFSLSLHSEGILHGVRRDRISFDPQTPQLSHSSPGCCKPAGRQGHLTVLLYYFLSSHWQHTALYVLTLSSKRGVPGRGVCCEWRFILPLLIMQRGEPDAWTYPRSSIA